MASRGSRRAAGCVAALLLAAACDGQPAAEEPAGVTAPVDVRDPALAELIGRQLAKVRAAPGDAAVQGELGLVYEANHLWHDAAGAFARAAALDRDPTLWRYHEAINLREAEDFAGALRILRGLALRRPNLAPVQHRLGVWLLEVAEFEAAGAAFRRTRALEPASPGGWLGSGEVLLARRRWREAQADLERALALDPGDGVALYSMGLALRGQGRLEEAASYLARGSGAVRRYLPDPLSARLDAYRVTRGALLERASDLIDAGRAAEGAELLERALEHAPDDASVLNDLARARLALGDAERARELYEHALAATGPTRFAAYLHANLAVCHLALEQPELALEQAQAAVALNADLARGHLVRGTALVALGRNEEALGALLSAARIEPATPEIAFELGDLRLRLGQHEEALESYRRALASGSEPLRAHFSIAAACLSLDRLEEAEAALSAARAIAPRHARVGVLEERLVRARASAARASGDG